jgi:response regulator RpfG family c-di-GMP phosphodiesterase
VRTAYNGALGYDSYFCEPSEWVITDIEMPELNGIDMVQCIRAINASVKTVYTTGAADKYWELLMREARRFGAQILPKPFAFTRVIEMLADKPSFRPRPPLRTSLENPCQKPSRVAAQNLVEISESNLCRTRISVDARINLHNCTAIPSVHAVGLAKNSLILPENTRTFRGANVE